MNWVSAIGQWVGAIGTITVAVVALRWEHRERRDRETAQARLVIITVDYFYYPGNMMSVAITNHSEQQVRWPRIVSISNARPPVRWGGIRCD